MKHERCKACNYYYNGDCEIGSEALPDGVFCWTFITGLGVSKEDDERLHKLNESWCKFKQCIDCVKNDYCDKELPDTQPCQDRMDAEQLHALYREKGIE